jgi:hypothetical protein
MAKFITAQDLAQELYVYHHNAHPPRRHDGWEIAYRSNTLNTQGTSSMQYSVFNPLIFCSFDFVNGGYEKQEYELPSELRL